jgi:Flp pilus assembly protein TadG
MIIKEEDGTAVVEFAIIAPLLFVILFGIIEFGVLLYDKAMITNAAREGARAGIVFDANLRDEDGVIDSTALSTQVQTNVNSYLGGNLISFAGAPSVIVPAPTVSDENGDSIISSGDSLTVTVNFAYQFLVFSRVIDLIGGGSFGDSINLQAVSVMRLE